MLVACANEQSPADVVRSYMTAVETFDLPRAESLVCEAQRSRVTESLSPFLDVAGLSEAFHITFEELSFQERTREGDMVVFRVTGKLEMSFLGQEEEQTVDEEHVVVRQDGRWVVCDP
jgi:hypothetical protein